MAKRPTWMRTDYEMVAQQIARQYDNFASHGSTEAQTILACVAAGFIKTFREDNPAFDVERFHKACGFKETT